MPEPSPPEHVYGLNKWSDVGYTTIDMLYLRPVRWFHRNFVERFRGSSYPYYHRKFGDVKTIDQCEIQDQVCFYEAEMAYLREKRIDTMIVEILHDRLTRCIAYEGRIDALDKCAKEKDALFESHANWYQKYGEMGVPHSCVDAYMKQKHLMIWMRRHPEVDLKGWAIEREHELGSLVVNRLIPILKEKFIKAQLWGYDLNKRNSREIKVAESQGVIAAGIFLVLMFIMIAIVFSEHLHPQSVFPHNKFVEYLAALLSICCMVLLGFADDVLDLRWSVKLLLPLIASLPLLLVYFANYHSTTIILPKPVRPYLGQQWNLGILYYVYMSMVAVFCTNAINILAGVNGLEVGQSIVIAISIFIFNLVELQGICSEEHLFSLYFMIPFIACTLPILKRNWCPAEIFVGDTLCYFAGMTFAVVGIIGHFSKTMLLFFIPQIVNFLLSVPQLFHFIPCPRHRLPRLNPDTNKLNPSEVEFKKKDLKSLGWLMLRFFSLTKFIRYREYKNNDNEIMISTTNFTIINTVLCWLGPLHEGTLCRVLLLIQFIFGTLLTFFIRYYLVKFFYDS